jgi:hypothetical protein
VKLINCDRKGAVPKTECLVFILVFVIDDGDGIALNIPTTNAYGVLISI